MRATLQIVGIILLINGIGGLVKDDFGLLANVADGGALTRLQVVAILVGAALAGGVRCAECSKSRMTHRDTAGPHSRELQDRLRHNTALDERAAM
ncbi:hypothetical protein [Hoyosella subflava]|uniref:Uncharacterized protein n=1 Tax=Hoyosella subflava (strain DSM 45089 / JCM 17490 / NBRC 109087 / DQS3-9A1) TaxID=443218 RepID=F6EF81_HOYSD|nr:hypothetical protein [Hoyosella subflava]AEF38660.1 hypothetical protein AS9A_0200 [Hoyosella subflava DQS3-9A1]